MLGFHVDKKGSFTHWHKSQAVNDPHCLGRVTCPELRKNACKLPARHWLIGLVIQSIQACATFHFPDDPVEFHDSTGFSQRAVAR